MFSDWKPVCMLASKCRWQLKFLWVSPITLHCTPLLLWKMNENTFAYLHCVEIVKEVSLSDMSSCILYRFILRCVKSLLLMSHGRNTCGHLSMSPIMMSIDENKRCAFWSIIIVLYSKYSQLAFALGKLIHITSVPLWVWPFISHLKTVIKKWPMSIQPFRLSELLISTNHIQGMEKWTKQANRKL